MRLLKRFLAMVLSLAMVIGTLTVTAFAEGEIDIEEDFFESSKEDPQYINSAEELLAYMGANDSYSGDQYYVLQSNIVSSASGSANSFTARSGDNITLDLNGHNITKTAGGNVFTVDGGTLTIVNEDSETVGEIQTNSTSTTTRAAIVQSGGSLYLKGGKLVSLNQTASTSDKAQAVYVAANSSFYMSGGEICGFNSTAANGTIQMSAITASATITGGKIHDNTAKRGGALATYGNSAATGGTVNVGGTAEIYNNTSESGGGAFYIGYHSSSSTMGILNISGGKIYNNSTTAGSGGAIYLYRAQLTVTDGEIYSNTASGNGGGIYNYNGGTLTISGGRFYNNSSAAGGFLCSTAASSSPVNTYNYITGGEYFDNTSTGYGPAIRLGNAVAYLEISGGYFYGSGSSWVNTVVSSTSSSANVTLTGGWYSKAQNPSGYLTLSGYNPTGACDDAPMAAAPYTVADSATYQIIYKDTEENVVVTSEPVAHGTKSTVSDYEPEDGAFLGWYLDKDLTIPAYSVGAEIELSKDTVFYASVSEDTTFDIDVYIDGIKDIDLSGTYLENDTITLPAQTKNHFEFLGYATESSGEVVYVAGDTITATADQTIYLFTKWNEVDTRIASITTGGITQYVYTGQELADAVGALTADATVTLLSSITTSVRISTMSHADGMVNITFDFNGYTLTYTGTETGIVNIRARSTITFTGSGGFIDAAEASDKTLVYLNANAYCIFESGTYTGNYTGIVNAISGSLTNTRATITGGTYTLDPTMYLDESLYEAILSEGQYTVSERAEIAYAASVSINDAEAENYTTLEAALTAAGSLTEENLSVTVTLLRDTYDGSLNITFTNATMDLTIDLGGHTVYRTANTRPLAFNGVASVSIINGAYTGSGIGYSSGNGAFLRIRNGSDVTIENVVFEGFAGVSGASGGNGGLFCVENGSDISIVDCEISGCYSELTGGVIYVAADHSGTVEINGTAITDCYATGNGGVISMAGACTSQIIISDCEIDGCYSGAYGGVVYLNDGASAVIEGADTMITDCSAVNNGGVVHILSGGTLNFYGGTISGCSSNANGGAFSTGSSNARITIGSTESDIIPVIDSCSASNGGAVYVLSQLDINSAHITGCSAGANGGSVYCGAQGTVTMSGGTIELGTAVNNGGNIYIYKSGDNAGSFTLSSGIISGGTANFGGNIRNLGSFTMTGGCLRDGSSGGGQNIYMNGGSTTTISGGTISGASDSAPNYFIYTKYGAELTITGGRVESTITNEGSMTITGGIFTANLRSLKGSNAEGDPDTNFSGGWFARKLTDGEGFVSIADGKTVTGICADAPDANAPYTILDSANYVITFIKDDGTTVFTTMDTLHGTGATLPDYTTETDYLVSWNTSADGSGTSYSTGSAVEFSADTALYAITAPYAVSVTAGSATEKFATLTEAFAAANIADQTTVITLLTNLEWTEAYTFSASGADITLDLNGKTLSQSGAVRLFAVSEGVAITICDSSAGGSGRIYAAERMAANGLILVRGTVNVTSGTIETAASWSAGDVLYTASNADATVNVSGGRIITGGTLPAIYANYGSVNISGGFIKSAGSRDVSKSSAASVTITGGYFANAPAKAFYDTDYYGWESDTESYDGFAGRIAALGNIITNVETGERYPTLSVAAKALNDDGQTLRFDENVTRAFDVSLSDIEYEFTIDLNGNTLCGETAGTPLFYFTGVTATIINGTIDASSKTCNRGGIYAFAGSNITLGEGLVVTGVTEGEQGLVGVYSDDAENIAGLVVDGAVINGADKNGHGLRTTSNGSLEFKSGTLTTVLYCYSGTTVVSGGFINQIMTFSSSVDTSITGGWFVVEPLNTVYETADYSWYEDSTTYPGYTGYIDIVEVVVYVAKNVDTNEEFASLSAAVAALASDGQTIRLLDDFDGATDLSFVDTYDFTLDLNGKTISGASPTNRLVTVNGCSVTIVNGKLIAADKTVQRGGVMVTNSGIVTLGENLEISGSTSERYGFIGNNGEGTVIVDGAYIHDVTSVNTGQNSDNSGIYCSSNGRIRIVSGTISSKIYIYAAEGNTSSLVVSGGTLSGYEEVDAVKLIHNGSTSTSTVEISGGTLTGSIVGATVISGGIINGAASVTSSVTGGYFTDALPSGTAVINGGYFALDPSELSLGDYRVLKLDSPVNGCEYTIVYAQINASSVTLANELALNYFSSVSKETYERITEEGKTIVLRATVTDADPAIIRVSPTLENDTYSFKFTFDGIDPSCMGEDITTEVCIAEYDPESGDYTVDEEMILDETVYSVAEYCNDLYSKISEAAQDKKSLTEYDDELVSLVADMMIYGKTAQLFRGYKVERLCSAAVISYSDAETKTGRTVEYLGEDLAWITENASEADNTGFENLRMLYAKNQNLSGLFADVSAESFDIKGATCMFGQGGYIVPRFFFSLSESVFTADEETGLFENVRVKVVRSRSGETKYVSLDSANKSSGDYYISLGTPGDTNFQFYPYEYGEQITVTLQIKTAAGKWRSVQAVDYSVNSYCLDMLTATNTNMADFAQAILLYGKSSSALYAAMN